LEFNLEPVTTLIWTIWNEKQGGIFQKCNQTSMDYIYSGFIFFAK